MHTHNKQLIEETIFFLSLCGEKDRNFLDIPQKDRKAEDYARLISITLIFGFRQVSMQLVDKAGKRISRINEVIKTFNGDYETVKTWVDEFIENISLPELKEIMLKVWQEKLKRVSKEDFMIKQLF